MKSRLFLLVAFLFVIALKPSQAQVDSALAAGFQSIIDNHMSLYGIEGVEATMIMPGGCEWTGGSGYATSPHDPVDTTRFWHFASTTKALTGMVMLQLIDAGVVNIDDPVGLHWNAKIKSIQSINNIPVVDSLMTIRRLLNHTTNIKNTWYSGSNLWTDVFDTTCTV
ncbi:MAG TPA: serine hydrolase domain-containing protein [Bacteroidia bacterium]|nr:serine hydrolase domain-containing protein [Bacteroidia bacterium]